jgi:colanic acid biosynthesis protein WcaM
VAIYGCDNFIIDNVDMVNSAGMLIGYGVIKGDYLSIPQNFKLNNIHLDNRSLRINCAEYRFHPVTPPRLWRLPTWKCSATLELHNKPQHLFLRNINVMQEAAVGPALKINFDLRKDVRVNLWRKTRRCCRWRTSKR